MKPNVTLDSTTTSEGTVLELVTHDGNFYIRSDGEILMQSRANWSEKELGRMGVESLGDRQNPRVLIGGLGMGFTLVEVCRHLPQKKANIEIVEISADLVDWNKTHMEHLHDRKPLEDPRVHLVNRPLEEYLESCPDNHFDSLMLDVDNGPIEWGKGSLYSPEGLALFKRVLKSDGILLIWTAKIIKSFDRRFRKAGFFVEGHAIPAFEQHKDGRRKKDGSKARGRVLTHGVWEGHPRRDTERQPGPQDRKPDRPMSYFERQRAEQRERRKKDS